MTTVAAPPIVGSVHSWDLSTGTDGPGTRVVVFTAGCPLRCLYCHNPDTWQRRNGTLMTVDEVVAIIARYRRFIAVAGGGVTLSGGEPLLQRTFTTAVLQRSKELGLHTAVDTSGAPGDRVGDELLDATDLVLLDVKSWDPATYRRLTGGDIAPTLRFGRRVADRGIAIVIRFVLVPGITDAPDNVDGVAAYAASLPTVERVDVLPLHHLGAPKYEALGIPYPLAGVPTPTPDEVEAVRARFRAHGLAVT
ncbi:MAG TPA: pyruvate formate-lyase-activating protein [Egibacteraceae bacterium]